MNKDLALVLFTFLLQMAVGLFWFAAYLRQEVIQKKGAGEAWILTKPMLIAAGPILGVGLLLSLLHLGSPLAAYRSILNLDTSWLSREIVATLLFGLLWLVCLIVQWRMVGSVRGRTVLFWTTAVVGFFSIFIQSAIYILPTRPAWDSLWTPLQFFTATLLLGGLAAAVMLVAYANSKSKASDSQKGQVRSALKTIALAAVIVIPIQALALVYQMLYLGNGTDAAQASSRLMLGEFSVLFWLRVVIGLVAGFVLVWLVWRALEKSSGKLTAAIANQFVLAFVVVIVGELVARYLFFETVVPVLLPGVGF